MEFKLLHIPVRIHPTFWIFLLFFTNIYRDPSIEGVIIGFIFFFSVLVHEYGHALTAAYFGAHPTVTLEAFGGNAQYNNCRISRKQELLITLNGPLFESILIAVPYFLLESGIFHGHYMIQYILYVTMRLNIVWVLFNLIPIEPLDGGKIVRTLLEDRFPEKGYKISLILGLVCVGLLVPYYLHEGFNFFALFLVFFAFKAYQNLSGVMSGKDQESPFSLLLKGQNALNDNDSITAKKIFKRLLKSKDQHIKNSAIELLAKIYFDDNESDKSYELLIKSNHVELKEGKNLLCKLAFEKRNYQLVGDYSWDIYSLDPSFETALMNSKAFACLNNPNLAGAWLSTAAKFGEDFSQKVMVEVMHPLFDLVRDHAAFQSSVKES